jgi:hypothetical protein
MNIYTPSELLSIFRLTRWIGPWNKDTPKKVSTITKQLEWKKQQPITIHYFKPINRPIRGAVFLIHGLYYQGADHLDNTSQKTGPMAMINELRTLISIMDKIQHLSSIQTSDPTGSF